ncbi:MAG TPA: phosphatidylglycerophosphatase A [Deltaproteobacteria bacterium]|jgi:phosphatidylglycerophosphatase A|nr:phosphatidylglycerophosphatase A [Deltaproteobacteria bacterium]HOI08007.1 phosphatidylglycerophosphatase A [Deltaproteobacteria bacterium]
MRDLEVPSRLIATFFGAGYSPAAPGTVATVATLPLYLILRRLSLPWYLLFTVGLTLLGVCASERMERLWGKDPGKIVIDEVAGTLIALVSRPAGMGGILLAMALFRFFDILKPPPVSTAEALPGGAGVMADDVVAGALSAVSLTLIRKTLKNPL